MTRRKWLRSGQGLPPWAAAYVTGTDHRAQVERAGIRRAKRRMNKARRRLSRLLAETDDTLPADVGSMSRRDGVRRLKNHSRDRDQT